MIQNTLILFLGIRRFLFPLRFQIFSVRKNGACIPTMWIYFHRLRVPLVSILCVRCSRTSSTPQQPIYLNWFSCVRAALADSDTLLASFLASGHPDYSFLPSRLSQDAVRGDFAQGLAAPVNPSLLALFERPLRPSLQLGLTICETAALEASFRANFKSPLIRCGYSPVC